MSVQGSSGRFSRIWETPLEAASVAGSHIFELNGHAARNNLMDYFYFIDSNGDPVDADSGSVLIELSPELPIYQRIDKGSFDAAAARGTSWCKPNGFGKAISIKITFADITGAPTGFRALITQSVS